MFNLHRRVGCCPTGSRSPPNTCRPTMAKTMRKRKRRSAMDMNDDRDESITSPMMRKEARYRNILKTRKTRNVLRTFSDLIDLSERSAVRVDPPMASTSM